MMKSIFLFLCMAVSTAMLGQNEFGNGVQMLLNETWVNGAWQNSMRGTYTANDDGYITNVQFEMWNTEMSGWDISRQVIYTSEGNTQISTNQHWDGFNWVNVNKHTWYYSDNTELADSVISQIWEEGAWINQQRVTNSYNNAGHLTHALYEIWDADSSTWNTSLQVNYTLGADGQAILVMTQLYEPATGSWIDSQKQTHDYTDGLLTHTLNQIVPPDWINSSEMLQSYDEQNRIHQILMNIWNQSTNSWNTSARITYFYETLSNKDYTKNEVVLYPNPAKDILTLSNTEPLTSVSVCAIDGRSFSFSPANNQIDVSMLPAGVYVLAAETKTGRQNIKFIKQ